MKLTVIFIQATLICLALAIDRPSDQSSNSQKCLSSISDLSFLVSKTIKEEILYSKSIDLKQTAQQLFISPSFVQLEKELIESCSLLKYQIFEFVSNLLEKKTVLIPPMQENQLKTGRMARVKRAVHSVIRKITGKEESNQSECQLSSYRLSQMRRRRHR